MKRKGVMPSPLFHTTTHILHLQQLAEVEQNVDKIRNLFYRDWNRETSGIAFFKTQSKKG